MKASIPHAIFADQTNSGKKGERWSMKNNGPDIQESDVRRTSILALAIYLIAGLPALISNNGTR